MILRRGPVRFVLSFVLLFFAFESSEAQQASASMFADMKSVNPAVIGQRKSERITVVGSLDRIKKEQTLDTAQGAAVTGQGETEIDVKSANIFRGGRGGGLTSEASFEYNLGSKNDKLASSSEARSVTTTADNSLGYIGFGFFDLLGFSAAYVTYKNDTSFSGSFGGQSFSMDMTTNVTAQALKAGIADKIVGLDIGLFYQRQSDDVKTTIAGVSDSAKQDNDVAGAAVGLSSNDFHFEVGYETELKSTYESSLGKNLTPARASGTIEVRLGKLLLGYTGRYYMDGFFELERVIYNQFVYQNSYWEPRLDNTFNFSYGTDKGSVFSGSIFYSSLNVKEGSPFFPDGSKVETKTTAMGASIKYSYAF